MLKKPALTFKLSKMEFNCAAVRLFKGITQILPVVNRARKRLAAIPCQEEESASVEWSRLKKEVYVSKTITSVDFVERIFDLMGWDRTCRYKILGRLAQVGDVVEVKEQGLKFSVQKVDGARITRLVIQKFEVQTTEVENR